MTTSNSPGGRSPDGAETLNFAGLSITPPPGYVDRSSVVLVLPAADAADPRLKGPTLPPVNLVLTREPALGRAPLDALNEKLAELGKGLPGFRVLRRGVEGELPFCEYTAQVGPALMQLLMVRSVGDELVVLTATAQSSAFAKHRDEVVAVLVGATLV